MDILNKHFVNKSVAFVAQGPSIKGCKLGAEIDSFDVVVRTNFFPLENILTMDYGTRADVMSVLLAKYIKESWRELGVKLIIHYRPIDPLSKYPDIDYIRMDLNMRGEVTKEVTRLVGERIGQGTAGINFIYHCLKCKPKRLKIFGITGYQNKHGEVVDHTEAAHYVLKRSKIPRDKLKSMRNHPAHKFHAQNNYIRYLLKENKIELDQHSLKYFIHENTIPKN